jgi:hypothetical protein
MINFPAGNSFLHIDEPNVALSLKLNTYSFLPYAYIVYLERYLD